MKKFPSNDKCNFLLQDDDYEPSTFSTNKKGFNAPAALLNDIAQVREFNWVEISVHWKWISLNIHNKLIRNNKIFRVKKIMIHLLTEDDQQLQTEKMNIGKENGAWLFLRNELTLLQKVS